MVGGDRVSFHPLALLVDERLIAVPGVRRGVPITQPRRTRAVSHVLDVAEILVQESEVFLVALADALQVPEATERGNPFAQPGVAIGRGPDAVAPPLVRDLMRPKELIEAVERRILKGHPGEIDHAGKRYALKVRDLGDVKVIEQRRTETHG